MKPMNTNDLLRQIEALLVTHQDSKAVAADIVRPRHGHVGAAANKEGARKAG